MPLKVDHSGTKINKLHMEFLMTQAELWPLVRARNIAVREEDNTKVKEIDGMRNDIIRRASAIHKEILQYRTVTMELYETNARFREHENKLCGKDFIRWINYFAWTFDPRLPPQGLPAHVPFILWPKQQELLEFVDDCYRNKRPWLVDKSRGIGATWLICAYYVHHWLFSEGFVGGFGSRKEELVDRSGDPSTLFHKIRYIIDNLPATMRPAGFDDERRRNDNAMRIVNPANGSVIIGEGGDSIGAGGRTSMYVIDEKALVEHQELVDNSLSFNTDCQGDISTPRGMNHFGKKRFENKVAVFTMWWYYDPSKNLAWQSNKRPQHCDWYEYQTEIRNKVTIAQEVDIDYHASVEGTFIPSEWIMAAVDFDLPAEGEIAAGFDVAGHGKNESVYIQRIGPVVSEPVVFPYTTPVEAAWAAVNQGEADGLEVFNYDYDGIGQSILGLFKTSEREIPFMYNGVYGQQAASDSWIEDEGKRALDKFANRRAELWWNLRERFRKTYEHRNGIQLYGHEELISIPEHQKLIQQLASPLMKLRGNGKILCESKADMRARGIESPDHADALVYSFASETTQRVVDKFNYAKSSGQYKPFAVDFERSRTTHYVTLVQTPDLATHALCCIWTPSWNKPLLQVYDEVTVDSAQPEEIVRYINEVFEPDKKPIKEWIANDAMFKDMSDGRLSPWALFRKAGVRLRQNYVDSQRGSVMLLNEMFDRGAIQIHTNCEVLFHQIREWTRKRSKIEDAHGLVQALCLLVTRLRRQRKIMDLPPEIKTYKGGARWSKRSKGKYPDVDREFTKRAGLYNRKYGLHSKTL